MPFLAVCMPHLDEFYVGARKQGKPLVTGPDPDHTKGPVVCEVCRAKGGSPSAPERWDPYERRRRRANGYATYTVYVEPDWSSQKSG